MRARTGFGVAVLALVASVSPAARAQDKGRVPTAGLESALERKGREWAAARVPESTRSTLDREALEELVSGVSLGPRVALADVAGFGMPAIRLNKRGEPRAVRSAAGGLTPGIVIVGIDGREDPELRRADVRERTREYLKRQFIKGILSRTALGRGLSTFIDTGESSVPDAAGLERDARSRMLPYVSPKVDAAEGKVALELTWKF